MENLSPEGSAPSSGSNSEPSTKKTSAEKKPTLRSPISQKQSEIASKIAQPSILERLTGERAKPEPKVEIAPKLVAPEAPPAATESTAASRPEQPEVAKAPPVTAEAETPIVEIPLSVVGEAATEYIDLHQQVLAELGPSAENNVDSALLEQAAEDIQEAPPEASFKEVFDDAYDQKLSELHTTPENFAPPVTAEAIAETPSYLPPPPEVIQQAQHQAAAEAVPAAPVTTAAQAETVQAAPPEDTSKAIPWFYRSGDGRRFYPGVWPPRSPEKSLVNKISEKARVRRQHRATERSVEQKLGHQTEAVQRYIDMKEQAIRTEATNQFADQVPVPFAVAEQALLSPAYNPATTSEQATPRTPNSKNAPEIGAPTSVHEQAPLLTEYQGQHSPQTAERVQRLDRRELLSTAEKIIVDGTSVRAIYESKRISEEGMRRVITEYYRGGDIKHTLDQELMIKELSYERDPQVRDILASRAGLQAGASTPKPATQTNPTSSASSPSAPKAAASQAKIDDSRRSKKKSTNPAEQALVRTWTVVVVVLALIAIVLLLRR